MGTFIELESFLLVVLLNFVNARHWLIVQYINKQLKLQFYTAIMLIIIQLSHNYLFFIH
jgi:hypothetical protein